MGDGEAERLKVCLAAPGDAAVVGDILDDVRWWLSLRGIGQWTRPFGESWVAEKIAAGEVFIAWVDGAPVAVVRLLWEDRFFWGERDRGDAGYVHTLAVRRDRAGQGIGAALLRWAEEEVRRHGRRFLRLDCAAENQALDAYYQGLGFVAVGSAAVAGETMMLYEKALTEEEAA
jgi:GNAT superfamily N-acetyltransferase